MQNQQDPYTKPEPSRQSGWEREIVEKLAFAAAFSRKESMPLTAAFSVALLVASLSWYAFVAHA